MLRSTVSVCRSYSARGMLRLRTTSNLLPSPPCLLSACLPVLPTTDSSFPCLIFGVPYFWAATAGAGRAHQDREGGTARGNVWLCLCHSEGRRVKRMGMRMYSADACGRNEGDDVCSAQAETIDNCQTTTCLPSTRKLDFFQKLQT